MFAGEAACVDAVEDDDEAHAALMSVAAAITIDVIRVVHRLPEW
jgi:hypothetical protein